MFHDAISIRYIREYLLEVEFEDGTKGIADFSDIRRTGVFSRFNNPDYFRNVYLVDGALSWPPGDLDIAPEDVYSRVTGKPVESFS
jgi:hypothetical protein